METNVHDTSENAAPAAVQPITPGHAPPLQERVDLLEKRVEELEKLLSDPEALVQEILKDDSMAFVPGDAALDEMAADERLVFNETQEGKRVITMRVPASIHAWIVRQAHRDEMSGNKWCLAKCLAPLCNTPFEEGQMIDKLKREDLYPHLVREC